MVLSIQIAKFKIRQYQLRAFPPNLMLAKVTHYTVFLVTILQQRLTILPQTEQESVWVRSHHCVG